MKIVFSDTNIIYGLVMRIIQWDSIDHSALFTLAKHNEIFISSFVLKELKINILENKNLILQDKHIADFLAISKIRVMESNMLRWEFVTYVSDIQDAQILQDAFDIQADYLLTKNIKDFNIVWIKSQFDIIVIRAIPDGNFI